ncbi:hypothetical protein DFH27DRAFT_544931 [Peziza echinospora]|nr:hypothetical protein DFH27DRAFT_544931 [Peziza echinospora]
MLIEQRSPGEMVSAHSREPTWSIATYSQDSNIPTGIHRSSEIRRVDESATFETNQHSHIPRNSNPLIHTPKKASAIRRERHRKSPARPTHHVPTLANSKVLHCVFETPEEPCVYLKDKEIKQLSLIRSDTLVHLQPFQCDRCGKRFGKKYGLNRHVKVQPVGYCLNGEKIKEERLSTVDRMRGMKVVDAKTYEVLWEAARGDWIIDFENLSEEQQEAALNDYISRRQEPPDDKIMTPPWPQDRAPKLKSAARKLKGHLKASKKCTAVSGKDTQVMPAAPAMPPPNFNQHYFNTPSAISVKHDPEAYLSEDIQLLGFTSGGERRPSEVEYVQSTEGCGSVDSDMYSSCTSLSSLGSEPTLQTPQYSERNSYFCPLVVDPDLLSNSAQTDDPDQMEYVNVSTMYSSATPTHVNNFTQNEVEGDWVAIDIQGQSYGVSTLDPRHMTVHTPTPCCYPDYTSGENVSRRSSHIDMPTRGHCDNMEASLTADQYNGEYIAIPQYSEYQHMEDAPYPDGYGYYPHGP